VLAMVGSKDWVSWSSNASKVEVATAAHGLCVKVNGAGLQVFWPDHEDDSVNVSLCFASNLLFVRLRTPLARPTASVSRSRFGSFRSANIT
jgi:hypothetical protein